MFISDMFYVTALKFFNRLFKIFYINNSINLTNNNFSDLSMNSNQTHHLLWTITD